MEEYHYYVAYASRICGASAVGALDITLRGTKWTTKTHLKVKEYVESQGADKDSVIVTFFAEIEKDPK